MYRPEVDTLPPVAPSATLQTTARSVLPVTVPVNWKVPHESTVRVIGEMVMASGAVTVTVATSRLVESDALVATTWQVPAVEGAVYTPPVETLPQTEPSCTDQLTAELPRLVTAAVKVTVPPAVTLVLLGEITTDPAGGAVTVTDATPENLGRSVAHGPDVVAPGRGRRGVQPVLVDRSPARLVDLPGHGHVGAPADRSGELRRLAGGEVDRAGIDGHRDGLARGDAGGVDLRGTR